VAKKRTVIASQFTMAELSAMKFLLERYMDTKEYGLRLWGERFYQWLGLVAMKVDEGIATTAKGSNVDFRKDKFTYADLRMLLNIVQSEGLRWAKNEGSFGLQGDDDGYWTITPAGEAMMIIMIKLAVRLVITYES
jgi:hypothetical protein